MIMTKILQWELWWALVQLHCQPCGPWKLSWSQYFRQILPCYSLTLFLDSTDTQWFHTLHAWPLQSLFKAKSDPPVPSGTQMTNSINLIQIFMLQLRQIIKKNLICNFDDINNDNNHSNASNASSGTTKASITAKLWLTKMDFWQ